MAGRKHPAGSYKKFRWSERRRKSNRPARISLGHEPLEDRRVLAPVLTGIDANDGTLLENGDVRHIAPTQLTFRFNPGEQIQASSVAQGIRLTRSGDDAILGTADDVVVSPGFIGIGDETNEVVMRFASALQDEVYRITIFGAGSTPLVNVQGDAFNNGQNLSVSFELDLGAKVLSVVPQPVSRNANGSLSQARDQILVYFNDDELSLSAATNPQFYKLIYTGHGQQFTGDFNTVDNGDDRVFVPSTVSYDANANLATLTFASDIDKLATGAGTYRLRIGTNEPQPAIPVTRTPTQDPGSSVATANTSLGILTNVSQIISERIDSVPTALLYPGSNMDPGHRQLVSVDGSHVPDSADDTDDAIPFFAYNFMLNYGLDVNGNPLVNAITADQKQRAREAFELLGHYLGVDFVETADVGLTIATGDVRVVDPMANPQTVEGIMGSSNVSGEGFPVAIMNAAVTWDSSYGGNWFATAMRQIGFSLGLGPTGDLPEGTLMGGNPDLTFGRAPEAVFPGDHDIVHGQLLYNPEGNDIDLYRFVVNSTGQFTAEIAAERLSDLPDSQPQSASRLDSMLRLFRSTPEGPVLVAQNDNYFSQDSFLQLELTPGTYFIGVSSTGNDSYSPRTADSGIGGTTEGFYSLRIDYRPNVGVSLVDTTGTQFDGDGDGVPGGVFNFWFRAVSPAETLFVDKATTTAGTGTLANPFRNISGAINAAQPGSIIRVVGNSAANPANVQAYQLGFDNLGQTLADTTAVAANGLLRIPDGVTMMIDAGSVFKSQRSAIVVGSTLVTNDASGGALQVLGTPGNSVIFTSYNDNSIGGNVNLQRAAARGDWGGILFRSDVDNNEGRFHYENSGIFLNYVNQADFRYGGGTVTVDVLARINPITMINTRPTVTNNSISLGADAALSANPDSFLETTFHEPKFQETLFTSDYSRIGPDIHGNRLFANTVNGLTIGNRFAPLADATVMTVPGRWNDDVVYVIQQGLTIAGTPGGSLGDPVPGTQSVRLTARPDARLAIDPGTVVKLEGGQIEVTMGATLLAEGLSSRPIVFSSLSDDRYGGSGSYDTDGELNTPAPGDWAGIYLGPTSLGSFDHIELAYGGGTGAIQGTFTHFNPIEIHQSRVRLTNSRFDRNLDGVNFELPSSRGGRTANAPGTIFVAGAQPVIVANDFIDNGGPAISINVNSLNHFSVFDTGRQTGMAAPIVRYGDNQGALIRENRITGSEINGMQVRGGTLTTESVWDDTDIVHVVTEGVFVPNFHTFGGLTLKSSPNQSLVIKLAGDQAGFVTTGSAIAIEDHIGGILNVIGRPGFPVVMTSLWDDSVGAGLDTNNRTQSDTDGGSRPFRTVPAGSDGFKLDINFGPRISLVPQAMQAVQLAASYWEQQFTDDMTVVIDVELEDRGTPWFPTPITNIHDQASQFQLFTTTPVVVELSYNSVRSAMVADAGAHEPLLQDLPSLNDLQVTYPAATVPFSTSEMVTLSSANAKALGFSVGSLPASAYDPRQSRDGTILVNSTLEFWDFERSDGLQTYREDMVTQMMREIGSILGFSSSLDQVNFFVQNPVTPDPTMPGLTNPIRLSPLDLFRFAPGQAADNFTNTPRLMTPFAREQVFYAGGTLDFREWNYVNMNVGEIPLATGFRRGDELNDIFGASYWHDDTTFRDSKSFYHNMIGVMDPVSLLRDEINFEVDPFQTTTGIITNISEADRLAFDSIGYDVVGGAPGDWQGIDLKDLTHDGNVSLIAELELADSASGTNDNPNNAEFLGVLPAARNFADNNRPLAFEVHGYLNALSDVDVYSFSTTAGTQVWIDVDRTSEGFDGILELVDISGAVLAQSDDSIRENVFVGPDLYSINELDPALRLTLPGQAGQAGTYYVRVRSFGDDLSNVRGGETRGRYEMQIRLRERDEVPGTSIEYADIRYAETGIDISAAAVRSPLMGEQTEDEQLNDAPYERTVLIVDEMGMIQDGEDIVHGSLPYDVRAQYLGNLGATRNGAISVYGNLVNPGLDRLGDVDFYRFEVDLAGLLGRDSLETTDVLGLVFDIDWADGLNRPDTALSVYDRNFNLLYFSDASNVAADLQGSAPSSDLTRGSYGNRDPFIGPVIVPTGSATTSGSGFGNFQSTVVLYAAVSSINLIPAEVALADPDVTRRPILNDTYEGPNLTRLPRRGESISYATPSTTRFPEYALNPNVPANSILTGAYQLEIRTAPLPSEGFIPTGPNANTRFADQNRERLQGVINVSSNSITNSLGWGIRMDDGLRDLPAYFPGEANDFGGGNVNLYSEDFIRQPHTQYSQGRYIPNLGTVRALPDVNDERLVPGINIVNNLIAGGFEGGVHLQGDPNGVILTIFDLPLHISLFDDFDVDDVDQAEFTLWDHHRNSQSFQFTTTGNVKPGYIPIRVDNDLPEAPIGNDELFATVSTDPTLADDLIHEIEHAIRRSGLDVRVFRQSLETNGDISFSGDTAHGFPLSLYVEGVVEIGRPDVVLGSYKSAIFLPETAQPTTPLPIMTAEIAQQGQVPYVNVVNNTIVGRGGTMAGGEVIGDVGLLLEDNVSPTLLNNIVANFGTAIESDLSSTDTNTIRRTFVGGFTAPQITAGGGLLPPESNFFPFTILSTAITEPMDKYVFGRFGFVYNRIFGGAFDGPLGHRDFDASPTALTGVRPTVIGGTLYAGNRAPTTNVNLGLGANAITLTPSQPLFVDAANGNYFLAAGSRAIDSSVDSLAERANYAATISSVGANSSGLVAPATDLLGVTRVDDPSVEPPSGLGNNVFKDRGALERADFVSPRATLIRPLDNDSQGVDQDNNLNSVSLPSTTIPFFEIQLLDGPTITNPVFGSGIDDTTVTPAAVSLFRNDEQLVEGVDYLFQFDSTNDSILLIPTAGLWSSGFRYRIELNNLLIKDRAENTLQANNNLGQTVFNISTDDPLDFGDAPAPYPTLLDDNGARHATISSLFLGQGVSSEGNGQPTPDATGDSMDDGVTIGTLFPGRIVDVFVNASGAGRLSGWIDFDASGSWGANEQVFADVSLIGGSNRLGIFVPNTASLGTTFARFRFSTMAGLGVTGPAPDGEVEDYSVVISQNTWQNADNPLDVTGDGNVVAQDINVIITEMNLRQYSDPATGRLQPTRPTGAGFVDVNGDGFVSPNDAIRVINDINNRPATAPLSGGVVGRYFEQDSSVDLFEIDSILDIMAEEITDAWTA